MNFQTKKFIESELSDYHDNIKALHEVMEEERDIIFSRAYENMGKRSAVARPTEFKALRIINLKASKNVLGIQRRINAIDKALDKLNEEELKFVETKYWKRGHTLTNEGIAERFHVDVSTIRRWNRRIITLIALEMGLV